MDFKRDSSLSSGIGTCMAAIIVLGATAASASAQMVYFADFEAENAGNEWSHYALSHTPAASRGFLGEFGNEVVTLNISDIDQHTHLSVSFDLYLIRSWDGNTAPGPDRWGMNVGSGEASTPIIDTTFAVSSDLGSWREQSWPSANSQGAYLQRTGAAENNTLGYYWGEWANDAVYHIDLVIPHTGSDLTLEFWASGLQDMADESWGMDNIQIEVVPAPGAAALFGLAGATLLRRKR